MDDQNELFIVVDKNDQIVGYKTRKECHSNKNFIHRSVAIVVFNDRGEILLQKRSALKKKWQGMYTISATGHVGKGESYKQAALRELKEEIGITSKLRFIAKFIKGDGLETEIMTIYKTRYNGPFTINTQEVESVEFFSIEQIKNMLEKIVPLAIKSLEEIKLL